ncbi:MAG TPA: hypothetical protein VHV55_03785 [Pirellulales bacterium]|nr:hypothetical protein [Pirellulales bacterium]
MPTKIAIRLIAFTALIACASRAMSFPNEPATAWPKAASAPAISQPFRILNTAEVGGLHARNPRVLIITADDSDRSRQELERLRRPGGDFETMTALGWKIGAGVENHLQIVDRAAVPDLVGQLKPHDYPSVACIDHDAIVRSFRSGCTTPLDAWTFGWLAKGVDERPSGAILEIARVETTGQYPLRGNHWSVDDDWSPTREKVLSHLRGTHGSQISATYAIETWSYEELRSLHDNLHEQELRSSAYATSGKPAKRSNEFSAGRKITGF